MSKKMLFPFLVNLKMRVASVSIPLWADTLRIYHHFAFQLLKY